MHKCTSNINEKDLRRCKYWQIPPNRLLVTQLVDADRNYFVDKGQDISIAESWHPEAKK